MGPGLFRFVSCPFILCDRKNEWLLSEIGGGPALPSKYVYPEFLISVMGMGKVRLGKCLI